MQGLRNCQHIYYILNKNIYINKFLLFSIFVFICFILKFLLSVIIFLFSFFKKKKKKKKKEKK